MLRNGICALAAVAALVQPAVAENWFSRSMHYIHREAEAINRWPQQYVCQDRRAVQAPFDIMVANGWRRENLLGAHHFSEDTDGKLTLSKAGEMKVYWILTQAPPAHRTIFVERTVKPDGTAVRVDAVQQYAVDVLPSGSLPDVQETYLATEGRPVDEVDQINVRYQESKPTPQLQTFQSAVGQ